MTLGLWQIVACPYCRADVRIDAGRLMPHTVSGAAPLGVDRCLGSGVEYTPPALARDSEAWDRAWRILGDAPENAALPYAERSTARDLETGESWQYMGPAPGGHNFRHRRHPTTGERVYLTVPS